MGVRTRRTMGEEDRQAEAYGLIRGDVTDRPARMPGVVMRPRDVFARLQLDAQSGQRVNFGQDAGARLEIERAAFALDSGVEEFIADFRQPRIRVAGNAQNLRAVAFERGDRGFYLDSLAAVRDGDHQVAGNNLSRAAMNAFGAVQKIGRCAGA